MTAPRTWRWMRATDGAPFTLSMPSICTPRPPSSRTRSTTCFRGSSAIRDRGNRSVSSTNATTSTVVWFDAGWRQRFEAIGKALPGATNVPISWSRDGNVVVLVSTSPTTVPTYYLYDATAKKLVKFGAGYPEIPPTSVVERRRGDLYRARRDVDSRVPGRATRRRCEAPSDRHPSTRRTLPARYRRLRLLGSVLRQPRLRRAATELPRLDRLWHRAF